MRSKILILFLFCFWAFFYSKAQLNVYPTSNANALATTIVGSGIQVSNATLNCTGGNSGTFTASSTNLGIGSGILLSTGALFGAIGPNNNDGSGGSSGNCPTLSDPQLTSITSNATYDGCILQFDIIPACNTLNINYVFASEEYPEWVCSQFNDVFGFFLSGPNPLGGSYVNTNIALVPGTSIPVAINTINPGFIGANGISGGCTSLAYSNYFVDNTGGASIQYDGFTTPLVAKANVTPCSSYHIKLAIADAGDCEYDSGVFLTYHGLTCPASQVPSVSAASTPVHCGNDGSASVNITNYNGTPTYSWAPSGATSSTINNLAPGTYTCVVGFFIPCPFTQTVTTIVGGTNVINTTISSSASTCNAANGVATVSVSGGTGPYTYSWSTIPIQTTATASALTPATYTVTITDNSGCVVVRTVTVANFQPVLSITDSIVNTTCSQNNGAIFINSINGGTLPYYFNWSGGQTSQNITSILFGNDTLQITDSVGCTWSYTYIVANLINIPIDTSQTNELCLQVNGTAMVNVVQGVAPYTFLWNTVPPQSTATATGLSAGIYLVNVTDAIGCTASASFAISNVNDVFNGNVIINPLQPLAGNNFTVSLNIPNNWSLTQSNWPDSTISFISDNSNLNFSEYGNYIGSFWVTSINGCNDTIDYTVFVKDFMTIYVPNAFSPNENEINDYFYAYGTLVKTFRMEVYDRWGNLLFETDDLRIGWDGFYKGNKVMNDVYVWKVYATDFFDEASTFIGHVTVVR